MHPGSARTYWDECVGVVPVKSVEEDPLRFIDGPDFGLFGVEQPAHDELNERLFRDLWIDGLRSRIPVDVDRPGRDCLDDEARCNQGVCDGPQSLLCDRGSM